MDEPNIPYQKWIKLSSIIVSVIFCVVFIFFPKYTLTTIYCTYGLAVAALTYRMIYCYKHGYKGAVRKFRNQIWIVSLAMVLFVVLSFWL